MQGTLTIAVASRNFFGAERRILKVVEELTLLSPPRTRVVLIINSSLRLKMVEIEWAALILTKLASRSQLVVIPDRPSHVFYARGLIMLFARLLSREGFHTVFRARPLAYMRAIVGLPAVVEITSGDVASAIARSAPKAVLNGMKAFHCVSSSVEKRFRDELAHRFPNSEKLQVNVTRVTEPFFQHDSCKYNLPTKTKLIVSASRFIPRKNALLFAKAAAIALDRLPADWRVEVLGQGEEQSAIEDALRSHTESGRAFVGYVTDVEEHLKAASIYVSLIQPDNYPSQSVLEAMRYGCALILSDTGESHLFLKPPPRPNGELVDLSVSAVAKAIVDLAQDQSRLNDYQASSLAHLGDAFAPGRHSEQLLALHSD